MLVSISKWRAASFILVRDTIRKIVAELVRESICNPVGEEVEGVPESTKTYRSVVLLLRATLASLNMQLCSPVNNVANEIHTIDC